MFIGLWNWKTARRRDFLWRFRDILMWRSSSLWAAFPSSPSSGISLYCYDMSASTGDVSQVIRSKKDARGCPVHFRKGPIIMYLFQRRPCTQIHWIHELCQLHNNQQNTTNNYTTWFEYRSIKSYIVQFKYNITRQLKTQITLKSYRFFKYAKTGKCSLLETNDQKTWLHFLKTLSLVVVWS